MKAYFFSVSFHLLFAAAIFFLAVSPGKALPPVRISQVFLVPSMPSVRISSVPTEAPPATPADSKERIPAIKHENEVEPLPVKAEKSLAEKLATRLDSAVPEVWNARRPERPREKPVTPAEEKSPPVQSPSAQAPASVSIGEGPLVESETGFSDGWYLTLLSRRLTERWNPVREGIALVKRDVTVSFTITRDGRIKNVVLARASGNPRFDRSGLTAVIESDFLPPLPENWGKKELQVSVRFREK